MYGTVIAIDGWGVMLRGKSGSGKSDLALRLIGEGARLVADDQVHLRLEGGLVYASAPARIAGLLEVRGIGVVPFEAMGRAPLALVLTMSKRQDVGRMPDAKTLDILGLELPELDLFPFEASAVQKVKVALGSLLG
jgi:serine kinase of HPr protein (carbohydrate metabolism regulator)